VVAAHHEPIKPGTTWNLSELVKVSCAIADAAGYPSFAGCEAAAYDELRAKVPEFARTQLSEDRAELAEKIFDSIRHIESV